MAKNRVIYQTEALFVGPSPATGAQTLFASGAGGPATGSLRVKQLHRVQSANYSFNVTKRDINQFGELAAIDRISLEAPTINLDFSYLNAGFWNEVACGYNANSGVAYSAMTSAISNLLDKTQDEKNYVIKTWNLNKN